MQRLSVTRDKSVAVVRFDHPPAGYMDAPMVDALDATTSELLADEAVRVLVFTGALDGVFIQHYDVGELNALARGLRKRGLKFSEKRLAPERTLDHVFDRLAASPKPSIAAINGNAMGGGFEFCLACDLRLAQKGPYSIGLPEINIGILPGGGGTQRLTRLVGAARALELVLRGRTVDPDEAARLGLVHETVDSPVIDRAMAIAHELAGKSPLALGHVKRLIRQAGENSLKDDLALERTLFLDLLVSDEAEPLLQEFVDGTRDIRTR
ncbi:MAG: enoyl-CoA hydratase/isomerase family protein [Reyranellaceae bacterium]